MDENKALKSLFGTSDINMISKDALRKKVLQLQNICGSLYLELFCADPSNLFFKNEPESSLVPMRIERIRRAALEAEKYKSLICDHYNNKYCRAHGCQHSFIHVHNNSCDIKIEHCGTCR
jgi:hypothetical protein